MATAADSLAQNLSFANFSKATDLKKRLWFTVGALIVFRLCSFVPLPGIDPQARAEQLPVTDGIFSADKIKENAAATPSRMRCSGLVAIRFLIE